MKVLLITVNTVLYKALQQPEFFVYCYVISVTPVSNPLLSTSLLSCKLLLMNLQFPWELGWGTVRFSRKTLLHCSKPGAH